MKNKYTSMEALDKDIKIHKLQADIAEETLFHRWQNLTQGVQQEGAMPKIVWGTLRSAKVLGFMRKHVVGTVVGAAADVLLRRWWLKR